MIVMVLQKQEIEARYAEAKEAVRLASIEAKKRAQAVALAEKGTFSPSR